MNYYQKTFELALQPQQIFCGIKDVWIQSKLEDQEPKLLGGNRNLIKVQ